MNKSDLDKIIATAINEEDSEEEILYEFLENELAEQKYDQLLGKYLMGEETPLIERISDYLSKSSCCSNNCCGNWDKKELINHANELQQLSKYEKKVVILTILRNSAINNKSTRYSEERQRVRFAFRYEPFGKMCATAFRVLFDIRIDTLKGLIAHLKHNNLSIIPPIHGHTGNKSNNYSIVRSETTEKLISFLFELAEEHGEFSPGRHIKNGDKKEDKNPDIVWLPCRFTRSAILRMYQQRYPDYPISRTAFCSILDNESRLKHIEIRSPRSDMCDFCELQKRKIAGTKPHDEEKAEKLTAELSAHQRAYQGEREVYNSERTRAESDRIKLDKGLLKASECVDHISMDFAQSIGVPHTTDQLGGTFYLYMRNFHLFGIFSVLENIQACYTYDEREAGKGSNEVISFLHHFLATRRIQTNYIMLHADNCAGQNKNNFVLWYLMWLVATSRVKHIEIKFMIKGHTHFIVDSGIGHVKRELRRSDVFCLKHWAEVIDRSSVLNKSKIVDSSDVYNWKECLEPFFHSFVGIGNYQHFSADENEPGWIWAKHGFDDENWEKRNLLAQESALESEKFQNLTKYLPSVGYKGGKAKKEKEIFENLRQYVKDEWKDEICPDPEISKIVERGKRICTDWK